jgi:AcrR family transcriptional regulator
MPAPTASARRQAVHDFKRGAILEAARRVFAEHGLEGATIRAIAAEAGYTPGAIYAYYAAKEEIFGDILAESLGALGHAIKRAGGETPRQRLEAGLGAIYRYYREHPQEFDLSLYLYQGGRGAALPREQVRHITGRLIAALQVVAEPIRELGGLAADATNLETLAALAQVSGILQLEASGQLAVLGFSGEELLGHYVESLVERLRA